jgi:hypothetical protein
MTMLLKLGTATWMEGPFERRALVAPLPSDPSRVVDLNRIERLRLGKLGEGRAEALADVLMPSSLRLVLESGPRGLQRVRQTLSYAEKWAHRGDIPESLAPSLENVRRLACLPRPALLRRLDGHHLDRSVIKGPGARLESMPQPTLAVVGLAGGRLAGYCLAMEDAAGAVLGGWLELDHLEKGHIELRSEAHHRKIPLTAWEGLVPTPLRAAEVVLLPAPRLRPLADLLQGSSCTLVAPFDSITLRLGGDLHHPTVQ